MRVMTKTKTLHFTVAAVLGAVGCGNSVYVDSSDPVLEEPTPEPCLCPEGTRYTTNGEGSGFCLVEAPLPNGVVEQCDTLAAGRLGFAWSLAEDPAYRCPTGGQREADGDTATCTWLIPDAFDYVAEPYCFDIDGDYLGYAWSFCDAPQGTAVEQPDGSVSCLDVNGVVTETIEPPGC